MKYIVARGCSALCESHMQTFHIQRQMREMKEGGTTNRTSGDRVLGNFKKTYLSYLMYVDRLNFLNRTVGQRLTVTLVSSCVPIIVDFKWASGTRERER